MKAFLLFVVPCLLWANALRCNKEQTRCYIPDKRLVIGDRVYITDEDNVIQAEGEVKDYRDLDREIVITRTHGPLTSESIVQKQEALKIPLSFARKRTKHQLSPDLGILTTDTSSDSSAFGFGLTGRSRLRRDLMWSLRAEFWSGSGSASIESSNGALTQDYSYTMMGLLGGITWEIIPQKPISFALSGELGFEGVSLASEERNEALERLSEGMLLAVRVGALAYYNGFEGWRPSVGAGFGTVGRSTTLNINFGVTLNRDYEFFSAE